VCVCVWGGGGSMHASNPTHNSDVGSTNVSPLCSGPNPLHCGKREKLLSGSFVSSRRRSGTCPENPGRTGVIPSSRARARTRDVSCSLWARYLVSHTCICTESKCVTCMYALVLLTPGSFSLMSLRQKALLLVLQCICKHKPECIHLEQKHKSKKLKGT
jgi:hypothetical protein